MEICSIKPFFVLAMDTFDAMNADIDATEIEE
jgi:hypothetical protein